MSTVKVKISGPFLDGRTETELARFRDDVLKTIARDAESTLRGLAARNFKTHPSGRWESELATTRRENSMVLQNPVIYNAWLEGEGSRNFPKTRFRGYRIWRKTYQLVKASAQSVADEKLKKYADRAGIEIR
jgi:hypothetical protein